MKLLHLLQLPLKLQQRQEAVVSAAVVWTELWVVESWMGLGNFQAGGLGLVQEGEGGIKEDWDWMEMGCLWFLGCAECAVGKGALELLTCS